jgi:hypothetical protein
MKMKKVLSLSSPPIPKDLLDKLISAVIQEEGRERSLEWVLNDDGSLDLFTEQYAQPSFLVRL